MSDAFVPLRFDVVFVSSKNRYLAKMLRLSQLEAGEVFLDMGSGTGKACLAAGLLHPDLAVCRGVELLNGLHREAEVLLFVRIEQNLDT